MSPASVPLPTVPPPVLPVLPEIPPVAYRLPELGPDPDAPPAQLTTHTDIIRAVDAPSVGIEVTFKVKCGGDVTAYVFDRDKTVSGKARSMFQATFIAENVVRWQLPQAITPQNVYRLPRNMQMALEYAITDRAWVEERELGK